MEFALESEFLATEGHAQDFNRLAQAAQRFVGSAMQAFHDLRPADTEP